MTTDEGDIQLLGSASRLSEAEHAVWFAWKRANEVVRRRIADDVAEATGLSEPDTAILIRLDAAAGVLRQNRLAASLGWDRTRLSHQLTRMESRGLLSRMRLVNGVDVEITEGGQAAVTAMRPVHTAAVRRHLLDPIRFGRPVRFEEALTTLVGAVDEDAAPLP